MAPQKFFEVRVESLSAGDFFYEENVSGQMSPVVIIDIRPSTLKPDRYDRKKAMEYCILTYMSGHVAKEEIWFKGALFSVFKTEDIVSCRKLYG